MINFPMSHWKRPDPHTWTLRTTPSLIGLPAGLAYARPPNNRFVAVNRAESVFFSAYSAVSRDGISWTAGGAVSASDEQVSTLFYAAELDLFIKVCHNGSGGEAIYTSPTGEVWTARDLGQFVTSSWVLGAWNGSYALVAHQQSGPDWLMRSTDGLTWAVLTNDYNSAAPGGLVWAPWLSLWVMFDDTKIYTSPTGATWTLRLDSVGTPSIENGFLSVAVSSDTILCTCATTAVAGARVVTSANGISWTTRTVSGTDYSLGFSAYGGGKWLLSNIVSDGLDKVFTSPDLATWTLRTGIPTSYPACQAVYSDHLEMWAIGVLGYPGTQSVYTSSLGT